MGFSIESTCLYLYLGVREMGWWVDMGRLRSSHLSKQSKESEELMCSSSQMVYNNTYANKYSWYEEISSKGYELGITSIYRNTVLFLKTFQALKSSKQE